ncbi:MAG: M3 family metallopeptidase [Aquimonas sp.]|nr:M3 family metallopeptidase [Aquimonas sp.]
MNSILRPLLLASAIASLAACSSGNDAAQREATAPATSTPADSAAASTNPLLAEWETPFGAPPFEQIRTEHFVEAFEQGMAEQRAEIAAITGQIEPPTLTNTLDALERSGRRLARVGAVFSNLAGTNSTPELQAVQSEMAPRLAAFTSELLTDQALFARMRELHESSEGAASEEQRRALERWHSRFVRAGAALDDTARARVAAIDQRMATLTTQFSQNNLRDTDAWQLVLESDEDLAGLPQWLREGMAQSGRQRGLDGKFVVTLQRSSVEPFLSFSQRRDLREQVYTGFIMRGDNDNAFDNNAIAAETVALRAERAALMGFHSHADFVISENMARTPQAAMDLMLRVWEPALARAKEERADMQAIIDGADKGFQLAPWDWAFYAEQVRRERFDLDQDEIKPYFEIDRITEAAFYVANRLFAITVTENRELPVYHPTVRGYEVRDAAGELVGLFYTDFFARPGKRSGAWMSSFRGQHKLDESVRPIVINALNVVQAPEGQPTLLSYDEASTLFHEFGHALHGLLSDVTYPSLAGTAVSRDYVEFPAQIYEHWLDTPYILERFARHHETNAPMPVELKERLIASRSFNGGFRTVEFLASGLVDMALHQLDAEQARDLDVRAFERRVLDEAGLIPEIAMRHRSTHFGHIFAGGYSAGYYSYLWSEVLDADGFQAFEDTGDIFDPATAERLLRYVYSAGNTRPPMEAWMNFRGAEPSVEALLRNRGFLPAGGGES